MLWYLDTYPKQNVKTLKLFEFLIIIDAGLGLELDHVLNIPVKKMLHLCTSKIINPKFN